MSKSRDRELGMERSITRRDFLNGVAISAGATAAASFLPSLAWADPDLVPQDMPGYYPPILTGMRGSHPGSFEEAHKLRDGNFWKSAGKPNDTGESYDLIIVGAGISGLAAAYFWRAHKPDARILILDNHDDFGGHAKRNEFHSGGKPGGRMLLCNGGTWAIESPVPYSKVARSLMDELGINPAALAAKCNIRGLYKGLTSGIFLDKETFGADFLIKGTPSGMFPARARSSQRYSPPRIFLRRLSPRSYFHRKKRPAHAHQLQGFSAENCSCRSARHSHLSNSYSFALRRRNRRRQCS